VLGRVPAAVRRGGVDRTEQGRVLPEYRGLQRLQLGSRVEAELVLQVDPVGPVARQRFGVASRAVEGAQQQAQRPFPERVRRQQPFELGDGGGVAAELERRVLAILLEGQPQLLPAWAFADRHGFVGEVGEQVATPQLEGVEGGLVGPLEPSVLQQTARFLGAGGEPGHVELSGLEPERVARRAGDEHLWVGASRPLGLEHLS
jgi:hypothetical protein